MWTNKGQAFLDRLQHHGHFTGANKSKMELPNYYDERKIKSAQQMFHRNYFAMLFSMYLGVIGVLAVSSILNVLIHTKRSAPAKAAYKRYIQTVFHTLLWFRNDIKPNTKAWKSLEVVRSMHASASQSASSANVGIISQKDLALTQFSYFGFAILFQKELGVQCSEKELENFCNFWRILGHLLGINDDYNICCENMDETLERLQIVRQVFLLPALSNTSDSFVEISKNAVYGLQCFDFIDFYEPIIFMLKRLIGVPNFYYLESEIPRNFDRNKLKYLQLSYFDRINLFLSVMTRQFLVRFCILRWFYNILSYILEFIVRYVPIIALIKFGPQAAYVKIRV